MTYVVPTCPQAPDHGPLLDWPTDFAAFYCPNVRHEGSHFYRTDFAPASRSGPNELVVPGGMTDGSSARSETPESRLTGTGPVGTAAGSVADDPPSFWPGG